MSSPRLVNLRLVFCLLFSFFHFFNLRLNKDQSICNARAIWSGGWWSGVNLSFSFRTPSTSSYLLVGGHGSPLVLCSPSINLIFDQTILSRANNGWNEWKSKMKMMVSEGDTVVGTSSKATGRTFIMISKRFSRNNRVTPSYTLVFDQSSSRARFCWSKTMWGLYWM